MRDNDRPLCKSYNFTEGHPDVERFPQEAAGLTIEGEETLPCASCQLKEWGSHPTRDTPWCSEQHTFPLLMQVDEDDPNVLAPALLTVQRSAISPSKTYLTAFVREKKPLFTVYTRITLDQQRRGKVDYVKPKFIRMGATPEERHAEFAEQYRLIRDFVQTPFTPKEEEPAESAGVAGEETAETTSEPTSEAPSTPAEGDEDFPF
jgi:hypothetical protein